MGRFAIGNVVLVNFPFSDLKGKKKRPALLLAKVEFDNYILCQITSKPYSSKRSIKITKRDFVTGSLPVVSFVRPNKLFTADESLVTGVVGELNKGAKSKILREVRALFKL